MTISPAQLQQRKQASQNSPWRRQAACKTDNAIKSAMRIKANEASMQRHFSRRAPRALGGFSWGRFPLGDTGLVAYRLFRRDHRGALHMEVVNVRKLTPVADIAAALRIARRVLRDRVDDIDLAAMGIAA